MANLSLLLTLALVAGLTGGVLIDNTSTPVASLAILLAWLIATVGFAWSHPRLQIAGVLSAMLASGWLLGAHAVCGARGDRPGAGAAE